jgi:hypothetical protein
MRGNTKVPDWKRLTFGGEAGWRVSLAFWKVPDAGLFVSVGVEPFRDHAGWGAAAGGLSGDGSVLGGYLPPGDKPSGTESMRALG